MHSIPRIRKVLLTRLESLVSAWAPALGIGVESLRDWVDGIVGEGIAIAISEQAKWDPNRGDFLHWAFLKTKRLLRRELKSESRYQRARYELKALAPLKADHVNLDRLRAELLEVLEHLPLEHQQALVLYYLHGMTVETLGEVLNKNPAAVYGLLGRARKKAQKLWKGLGSPANAPTSWYAGAALGVAISAFHEDDRRKETELRAFVNRLFALTELPIFDEPRPRPLSANETKGERAR